MSASQSLRVLMITVRADFGGGPEHVFRLISYLPAGIEVSVACPRDYPYWNLYVGLLGEHRVFEIPHRHLSVQHIMMLRKYIRQQGIDIIHSHGKGAGIYGRILALLARKPCVHTSHGVHVGGYNCWQKWLYLMLERGLSAITCRVIAVSPGEGEQMMSLHLCKPGKLAVIPNGVVIPVKAVASSRNNGRFTVLSMTRFNYQKNAELLIPVIECLKESGKLQEFQFVLLGTGTGEAQLKADVERRFLSAHVTFCGAVPNPGDFLRTASCYLSTSRWEGSPLAVLEAMANGVPVIASRVVGNCDAVVHGSNGFLYELDSPETAAEYLIQLADDPDLRLRLSQASRARAISEYSADRMAMEVAQVYYDLYGRRGRLPAKDLRESPRV